MFYKIFMTERRFKITSICVKTMDCVCGTKVLSKLIANSKFVHWSRKDQTAKMVVFIMFWTIFLEREVFSSNL